MRFILALTATVTLFPLIAAARPIGENNREPISDYAPESAIALLGRAVGRIDMLFDNGTTGFCTAVLIEGDRVLTADYCVPGRGDNKTINAQFVAGFTDQNVTDSVDRYTVDPIPLEVNNDLNYSVLNVNGNPTAKYGAVGLGDYEVPVGTPLWLIGHPLGEAKQVSREGCIVVEGTRTKNDFLAHGCDTLGGDSAAPLFDPTTGLIVGFHTSADAKAGVNYAIRMSRVLAASSLLTASPAPAKGAGPTPHLLLDALLASDPADLVDALDELASTDPDTDIRAKAQRLLDTLRLEMTPQE